MKTLAETRQLCRGGVDNEYDPLYDETSVEAEKRLQEIDGSLYLPGSVGSEYCDDLLITPTETGWLLQYRDPEGAEEPIWGREWLTAGTYEDWQDLVSFAYCM